MPLPITLRAVPVFHRADKADTIALVSFSTVQPVTVQPELVMMPKLPPPAVTVQPLIVDPSSASMARWFAIASESPIGCPRWHQYR